MSFKGIDISYWQGQNIDWNKVKSQVDFVYIKVSEGTTRIEPYALTQATGAKAAGIPLGYYHFAKPTAGGGADEANFFINKALQVKPPADLIAVLDIEVNPNNLTAAQITKWIEDFYTAMKAAGHQKLMLYSYQPFFNQWLQPSSVLADTKLWLACYNPTPRIPKGWSNYDVWQYTQKGQIQGIQGSVDLNTCEQIPLI